LRETIDAPRLTVFDHVHLSGCIDYERDVGVVRLDLMPRPVCTSISILREDYDRLRKSPSAQEFFVQKLVDNTTGYLRKHLGEELKGKPNFT